MSLDDRAADRQAHAHTVGFSREKRVENPIDVLRVDSCPAVRNRYHDAVAFVWLRFDAEHPWIFLGGHRVNGICDQVDQYLLQLTSISSHLRQVPSCLGLDQYSVLLQIATFQDKRFLDDFIDI